MRQEILHDRFPSGLHRYLKFIDENPDDFKKEISYSFWQLIDGDNISVTADDALGGRYHVTAYRDRKLCKGGGIYNSAGEPFSGNDAKYGTAGRVLSPEQIRDAIALYEKVRSLPNFSQQQCAIMEMQLGLDNKLYFLQYHKTRRFALSKEHIDPREYPEEKGWIRAQAVRGALGPLATLRTASEYPKDLLPDPTVPEEASVDLLDDPGIGAIEALSRRHGGRGAYIALKPALQQYSGMADGVHALRTQWYMPFASFAIGFKGYNQLFPDNIRKQLDRETDAGKVARVAIDYASDGQTGFVRLSPDPH